MRRKISWIALCVIAIPGGVAAQDSWTVSVVPRFGFFHADKGMGQLAPDRVGSPIVRLQNSPLVGIALELETPVNWLTVRGLAEHTLGADLVRRGLVGVDADDGEAPGPGQVLQSGTSVLNLAIGVRIRPLRSVPIYAITGAGLKRYDFGSGGWTDDPRYRFGGRESAFAVHYGLGTEFGFRSARILVEATSFTTGFGVEEARDPDYARSLVQRALHERLGHDLSLSVGLRVPITGSRR